MTLQRQIDQLIAHQASEWIEILQTGGARERAAFVDWLCESRKHVAEFLAMTVIDGELNEDHFKDLTDKDLLLKRLSPGVTTMSGSLESSPRPLLRMSSRSIRRHWPITLAAGIGTVALALALLLQIFPREQDFTTTGTEQRAIELGDGSVVLLNTASHVHVRLDQDSRELQLLSGEALFKVAKDPRRPFTVRARDMRVQAVGTQFNVNARKADAVVAVLEGKVLVSSASNEHTALLGAGEAAAVNRGGSVDRAAAPNAADAAGWRQKRLVFKRTTLEDVIARFNRHNATPKLRLEGIDGESRHYSMIFDAEDPGSFAAFLSREEDLLIERRSDEILIRPRGAASND